MNNQLTRFLIKLLIDWRSGIESRCDDFKLINSSFGRSLIGRPQGGTWLAVAMKTEATWTASTAVGYKKKLAPSSTPWIIHDENADEQRPATALIVSASAQPIKRPTPVNC